MGCWGGRAARGRGSCEGPTPGTLPVLTPTGHGQPPGSPQSWGHRGYQNVAWGSHERITTATTTVEEWWPTPTSDAGPGSQALSSYSPHSQPRWGWNYCYSPRRRCRLRVRETEAERGTQLARCKVDCKPCSSDSDAQGCWCWRLPCTRVPSSPLTGPGAPSTTCLPFQGKNRLAKREGIKARAVSRPPMLVEREHKVHSLPGHKVNSLWPTNHTQHPRLPLLPGWVAGISGTNKTAGARLGTSAPPQVRPDRIERKVQIKGTLFYKSQKTKVLDSF